MSSLLSKLTGDTATANMMHACKYFAGHTGQQFMVTTRSGKDTSAPSPAPHGGGPASGAPPPQQNQETAPRARRAARSYSSPTLMLAAPLTPPPRPRVDPDDTVNATGGETSPRDKEVWSPGQGRWMPM